MLIKPESKLTSLESLKLSGRVLANLLDHNYSLGEIVRTARIDHYKMAVFNIKIPKYRQEVAMKLAEAGFIRLDIEVENLFLLDQFKQNFLNPEESSIISIEELVRSGRYENYELIPYEEQCQLIKTYIQPLPQREQEILCLRFGVDCDHPHTHKAIGKIISLSDSRVETLIHKSFHQLKRLGDTIKAEELITNHKNACATHNERKAKELRRALKDMAKENTRARANLQVRKYLFELEEAERPPITLSDSTDQLDLSCETYVCLAGAKLSTIYDLLEAYHEDTLVTLIDSTLAALVKNGEYVGMPGLTWTMIDEIIGELNKHGFIDQIEISRPTDIEALGFPGRLNHFLKAGKVIYAEQLFTLPKEKLCQIQGIGQKSLAEIEKRITNLVL